MKAIFKNETVSNVNWNIIRTKELINYINVIDSKLNHVIKISFYMGRSPNASTVYCTFQLWQQDFYFSTSGNAGGYGYHKQSAALSQALDKAGINLEPRHLSGYGDSAITDAIGAIMKKLKIRKFAIIKG